MNHVAVCIIIAFAVPALAGALALLASGRFPHPVLSVTAGTLVVWAVMEVCLVPLVRIKASFRGSILVFWTALVLVMLVLGLLSGHRILEERKRKAREKKNADKAGAGPAEPSTEEKRSFQYRLSDVVFLIPLILVLIMVLRGAAMYQHTDDDDTRFVVNAVDMVRTDTLLLSNPANGSMLDNQYGELKKDAVAPWAFYTAMLAEMSGLKASVIAHTYLPPILMLIITCALFALGQVLFDKERWKIYVFVTICWVVTLFGYYSIYSAEAFVMGRLWQGKAVLAGFGIPVLMTVFFSIYRQPERMDNYVWLAAAVLALDLLTSQSIIITSAAAAFFALAYAIALKKPLLLLKMGVACIPNLILLAVYALI